MLEQGWLRRQVQEVEKDVSEWPDWMRKAAKFNGNKEAKDQTPRREDAKMRSAPDINKTF